VNYRGVTEKIITILYRVYDRLGFLEKVHENAMIIGCKKDGIAPTSQSSIKVLYEDDTMGE